MSISTGAKRTSFLILIVSLGATAAIAFKYHHREREIPAQTISSKPVPAHAILRAGPLVAPQPPAGTPTPAPEPQQDLEFAEITTFDPADASAFTALAESEISRLDKPSTLSDWMKLTPVDQNWKEVTQPENPECLSQKSIFVLPSGAQALRTLSFYPPPVSPADALPALRGRELINSTCTLAKIQVEIQASNETVTSLVQAINRQFSAQYGESAGKEELPFWGRLYDRTAERWVHTAEIVTSYRTKTVHYNGKPVSDSTILVLARLPIVYELERGACCTPPYHYIDIDRTSFYRAISIAGAGPVSTRMEKLYEDVFRLSSSPQQVSKLDGAKWRECAPLLREWLAALKSLPPAQRAAGLLAADLLLTAVELTDGSPLGRVENPLRSQVEQQGAVFQYNELGGSYSYTNNWLKQAQELDPNGKVGQLSTLVSLAGGSCDFRQVIRDGERLLSQDIDAPTAAQVHFMVADAYADIVALAGGAAEDSKYDPAQFQGEADSARNKALQYYQDGLSVDNASEKAKAAWRQAWRLSAGLLPDTRYVCVND